MKGRFIILFFVLFVFAGLLRVPHLEERPMHHDEANQAYRFGQLLETGKYVYKAEDHHGPTLYYFTLPFAWVSGAKTFAQTTEFTYRSVPLFFGILLLLSLYFLRRELGDFTVLWSLFFTGISAAIAFYNRFYIQESMLLFFTFWALISGWKAWVGLSKKWAVVFGLSVGLMFATKETAILAYAAMFGSALICFLLFSESGKKIEMLRLRLPLLLWIGLPALAVFLLFFSSFFTHFEGLKDAILAFKIYFARGVGQNTDHVHPWYYYLKILLYHHNTSGPVWSEALLFGLGLLGGILILLKKIPAYCSLGFGRFLLFYTLLLTLIYSFIAYKTPWCLISFLHGWILLAGIAVASIFYRLRSKKWAQSLVLLLLLIGSFFQIRVLYYSVFRYSADSTRIPYAYVHTSSMFLKLIAQIDTLASLSERKNNIYIQAVLPPSKTWPLPFYLRKYPVLGFWTPENLPPAKPLPDLIISDGEISIPPDYFTQYFGLRENVILQLHISPTLWEKYIQQKIDEQKKNNIDSKSKK